MQSASYIGLPDPSSARATRILVIDDSLVARTVITRILANDGAYAIVGAVASVANAMGVLKRDTVDVILLDLNMPGVDGLTALPDILVAGRGARVLVVSSACKDGAVSTVQALALGAADTLVKPGAGTTTAQFARTLEDKIARLAATEPTVATPRQAAVAADFDVVALGASTGGIHALSQLLRAVPAGFTAPILITQHLPAAFMPYFAAQIAIIADRPCEVAADGMEVRSGRVLLAPGTAHLTVVRAASQAVTVRLDTTPVASGFMPSVDPMLESVATVYGARGLGVVLSGMGRDGVHGATSLDRAGGAIVAQDRDSSVIWGMPGAVVNAGIADAVLPPDQIGTLIARGKRPS